MQEELGQLYRGCERLLVGQRRAFLVAVVVGVLKGLGLSPVRETRQVASGLKVVGGFGC